MSALAELVRRVRSGDAGALCAFVERLSPPGLRLAIALLRDEHKAEEAVQDALTTALARLADLRDADALEAWFRQIVRTEVSRRRRRKTEIPRAEGAEVASSEPTPPEQLERRDLEKLVRDAVRRLSATSRQSVEMFYLEEKSIAEIAASLEVPEGTVKRRLHTGRSELRELLGGADHWVP